ncbi:DEAD/DEAH box helicase [Streptomyces polygonati]|uniref:DEAD/DEAH box helicase n=1 Tax=Streptomyces polygonati TaxID=1617087 RepID=A0ABV8HT99_9ACTN
MVEAGVAVGRGAAAVLARAGALRGAAQELVRDYDAAREAVAQALVPIRDGLVRRELAVMPVARLADATEGRLRIGALEKAGYETVGRVYEASAYELSQLPGVGRTTIAQAQAAAAQLAAAVEEAVAVPLVADQRGDAASGALVVALHRLVAAGPQVVRARETAGRVEAELTALMAAARPARGRLTMLVAGRQRRDGARAALLRLDEVLRGAAADGTGLMFTQASVDLLRAPGSGPDAVTEAWIDFELRAAEFHGLLGEFGGPAPDAAAAQGFLPSELAERVRAQPLDDRFRRVSLRGYQAFGARFALAQRRVVLGDEMGLGKTVQAIAAMAHLKAEGQTHFLVVCPASVLVGWLREIESRSTLRAYRVHGPDRALALKDWLAEGDVAVTTYDALRALDPLRDAPGEPLGMLVADEAHYVKNPEAARSKALVAWTERADRVLLMTGTPMENRVEEFRNLVGHVCPELLPQVRRSLAAAGPQAFRKAVGPAYLRRNQVDVLSELPELVRVDEWEELSTADLVAYRAAVAAGNFMAMRRAAYADPARSAKLQRLREVVREAAQHELKVVVFSYFRPVLDAVAGTLGRSSSPVIGAITGSTPATERQRLADEFTAAPGHAVLLAQIEAGGVGLNLQAASVVVLCEPQIKPTTEEQAIARAHRMGQIRRVRVHRLLGADSVDQRILEILAGKSRAFDAYARLSDTADSAPEALDISEQSLARLVVEAEQQRLAGAGVPGAVRVSLAKGPVATGAPADHAPAGSMQAGRVQADHALRDDDA